ncbi:MAG: hypothetical protein V2I36_18645 [Desulfopila sp.]|nr:hypothetical protein [Desulfopila sp.]
MFEKEELMGHSFIRGITKWCSNSAFSVWNDERIKPGDGKRFENLNDRCWMLLSGIDGDGGEKSAFS